MGRVGRVGQAFSVLCHEALMHACTMGLKVSGARLSAATA